MDEKLSVAPMMDYTDRHFRQLLRFITKKTVLYTEMIVDETILFTNNLDFYIGRNINEHPSIIQVGGHDPDMLSKSTEVLHQYLNENINRNENLVTNINDNNDYGYGELNLNCGCPSQRVSKKCFGATLMYEPELVREIVYKMGRHTNLPISVKCRIGVDNKDSYDELKNFISVVHSGGVNKFIIHSRKCILKGLTPKQNRDIPPLKYEVVHRLVRDFPELKFILNGGILTLNQAKRHMDEDYIHGDEVLPSVHGVMIGRAVYNNPLMLSTADSEIFHSSDPCLTRREILYNYIDYCEDIQSDNGIKRICSDGKTEQRVSTSILLNAMRNISNGMRGSTKFKQALNDLYVERVTGRVGFLYPSPREIIEGAMDCLLDHELDAPLGNKIDP